MQVTQYTWGEGSSIQKVDVRKLASGALEAYIHAPANASAGDLANVPIQLGQKGYTASADEIDGVNVLRVSGFKKGEDLAAALTEAGFVRGEPSKEVKGPKEHQSLKQRVGKQTVKLSGVFGIVGHAAMAAAGILEKDYKRVATALFYTTSTSTSAIYGAGMADGASKVIGDMKDYLKAQGVEIPQGSQLTPEELAKKGGVIETLHHYIKSHPLEIGNTVGLMGNVMLTYSGLKNGDGVSVGRTASGLASMIGALSIILVPEKGKGGAIDYEWPGMENIPGVAAKDPTAAEIAAQKADRSLPKKFADWVQERPMRFAGLLNVGGNLALFHDAHSISKRHKQTLAAYEEGLADLDDTIAKENGSMNIKDIVAKRDNMLGDYGKAKLASRTTMFAYTTAACYLVATAFTSMSSKAKVSDYNEQEMVGKLCAMSANLIAEQPRDLRDEAIDKMALYLSKQEDVTESKAELIDIINEKVDKLVQSPWMAKVSIERAQQANNASLGNSLGA
jgi:hypothetical protein